MSLVEHPATTERPTATSPASGPTTPERSGIESPILWTSCKCPGEARAAFATDPPSGSKSPFAHRQPSKPPYRASEAPVSATDSTGDISAAEKLYRTIYRRKRLGGQRGLYLAASWAYGATSVQSGSSRLSDRGCNSRRLRIRRDRAARPLS